MKIFRIILAAIAASFCTLSYAQGITGKVTDRDSIPLAYASVLLMHLQDSSYVSGTATDSDGRFFLNVAGVTDSLIVSVSHIGYKTAFARVCTTADITVMLTPESSMLEDAVVRAQLPSVTARGDAIITAVNGSVLSKTGTASDVLSMIPGLTAHEGSVEVFGSGLAEIYINGRKMRNTSELDRIASQEIKEIQVVRNPGARYDASAKAVVRIITIKHQGEGFGFANRLYGQYQYAGSGSEQFTFNYRKSGFDLCGMVHAGISNGSDNKKVFQETHLDKVWKQQSDVTTNSYKENIAAMLSVNYQFSPLHSAGIRYDADFYPSDNWSILPTPTCVYTGEDLFEQSISSGTKHENNGRHLLNTYYSGQIGSWAIDLNADGFWLDKLQQDSMSETTTAADGSVFRQPVTSRTEAGSMLYAIKATASGNLWKGNLSAGGEYSYSSVSSSFVNLEGILDNSDDNILENSLSVFAEYALNAGKADISAGIRYEHLDSRYYQGGKLSGEQSRTYDNIFPSASVSFPLAKAHASLSYSSFITRPGFDMLRSNITYANKYTYESGNPLLKPSISNKVSMDILWKWVHFNMSYLNIRDCFLQKSTQYSQDNPAISLLAWVNVPSIDKLFATVTVAPKIGLWSPQVTASAAKQWFIADTPQGKENFGTPTFNFQWNNAFKFPKGFSLSINMRISTPGDYDNFRFTKPFGAIDMSLYKGFFDDRFSILLQINDITQSAQPSLTAYSGRRLMSIVPESRRSFMISLRYNFNTSKSKYLGSGAGISQKERM